MYMIEIWSNADETEYAISTSEDGLIRAMTNPKVKCELLVDAIPFFRDLDYRDWRFTLQMWIKQSKVDSKTQVLLTR